MSNRVSVSVSVSGDGRNRTVSSASRERGRTTSHADRARSPTSRAISPGYLAAASGISPPPPKQPQSIESPRAQALLMPMMNATKSSEETAAELRTSTPTTRHRPMTTSTTGSRWPTAGTTASGRRSYARTARTLSAG